MTTPEDGRLLRAALEGAQHEVKVLTKELQRLRALQPDALLEQVARLQNQVAQLRHQLDVADQVRVTWLAERAMLKAEVGRLTEFVHAQRHQLERADEVRDDWDRQLRALRTARHDAPPTSADLAPRVERTELLARELADARRSLATHEATKPAAGLAPAPELDAGSEAGHKPSS